MPVNCEFAIYDVVSWESFFFRFVYFLNNKSCVCECVCYVCLCVLSGIQGDQSPKSKPEDRCMNLYCRLSPRCAPVSVSSVWDPSVIDHSNRGRPRGVNTVCLLVIWVRREGGLQGWSLSSHVVTKDLAAVHLKGCVLGLSEVWFRFSVDLSLFPKCPCFSDQVLKMPWNYFQNVVCSCYSSSFSMFLAIFILSQCLWPTWLPSLCPFSPNPKSGKKE